MKCPRCQQENPEGQNFCGRCGTPVQHREGAPEPALSYAELERSLSAALEQQRATGEILRVISESPTDSQPVFDAIVRSASRLCGGEWAIVTRYDGELLHLAAQHNPRPGAAAATVGFFPQVPRREGPIIVRAFVEGAVIDVPDVEAEDLEPSVREFYRRIQLRAALAVPMIRDGRPIGVLSVSRGSPGPFLPRQVDLLQTFADQAVIAIDNVRLFTELETRNRQLTEAVERETATADILRAISHAQTDAQPVFDAIADSAMRLLEASAATVVRYDGDMVSLVAARGGLPGSADAAKERFQAPHRPWPGPEQALLSKTVHHVIDVHADLSCDSEFRDHAAKRGIHSFVAVPMLHGDDVVGMIVAGRAQPGGFSAAEIALLQRFADQAVIAIENVRLFTELQAQTAALRRSVEQLTALGEVGRAVSSTLDLETVLTTIVSRAVELSGLDGGVVFEYDESAEEFVQRAMTDTGETLAKARRTTRIRKGEGVLGRTAITLEPVQVADIATPGAYEGRLRDVLLASGIRAILSVPMVREDHLIGCVGVTRNRPGEFPAETIELLRTFATQSALAIQNARLFREIEQKSRELEAASRHKSEFLANMSHELRTPLNAVIGFSEVLRDRMFGDLNEKQEEYLNDIHSSGQHLLSLINDILDLSKIEAGRMELEISDFDLPMTLDHALTLVRERAGRHGIVLNLDVDERIDGVRADERKVRQVVLNLLSNAIKFTPDGGRIDVRAAPRDGDVEVAVSDTGVGIAPEDQDAIFEEFRQVGTAAKKVEGTGLGLALSRKFIELHGGRIAVESQVGVGSTFTFTIPVRRGESIQP
jgi:two-component system, NtrC family, sensor kinase